MRPLRLALAAALAGGVLAAAPAPATHCPDRLPRPVYDVCNRIGNVTRIECWSYPDGTIACRIPD